MEFAIVNIARTKTTMKHKTVQPPQSTNDQRVILTRARVNSQEAATSRLDEDDVVGAIVGVVAEDPCVGGANVGEVVVGVMLLGMVLDSVGSVVGEGEDTLVGLTVGKGVGKSAKDRVRSRKPFPRVSPRS